MGHRNGGRRPSPTALHVLRGNPSRKVLNQREPIPPPGPVTKPAGLSAAASALWDELAPIALSMQTLTTADVRAFATLCELQGTFLQIQAAKTGVIVPRVVRLERTTAAALRAYYTAFGLDPASRSRLVVQRAEAAPSKWA